MENKKLRVLLITSMPWRNDNNIGNSYSNIFSGMDTEIEFAHIYCRSGMPQNSLCHHYFQINEQDLIGNILKKKPIGKAFDLENPMDTPAEKFSAGYNKMRIMRWEIFFLARNMLWSMADWKTERLDKFVEDFKPDLIFGTLTYMPNINKIKIYLNKKYGIPLFLYSWDDVYSLKQFSMSPFYWIRRFNQRKWIKKCVARSSKLYTITDMMGKEYGDYFNKTCSLLYKGHHFEDGSNVQKKVETPITISYTGNIGAGRWKVIAKLSDAIAKINSEIENQFRLNVYTLSPVNEEMRRKIEKDGCCYIMPPLSSDEVINTMNASDILLHVEPVELKDKLTCRLSFSTKLVDYFYSGKCILALGGYTASMDYLQKEDAAIVELDLNQIESLLRKLSENTDVIKEYGQKAWDCGKRNHDITAIQRGLKSDFSKLS